MFEGCYTALVTPFTSDGAVDYGRLSELVDSQVESGVDGLVPVGTTGESPTLSVKEHHSVVEFVIKAADGRVKVIAGTGGNSTSEAIDLTIHAKEAGADGTLQVTPYYNKPNQKGLIQHFSAVADIGLPVVLYNIPGRTSREISFETVVELAGHDGIVAVKEAGGDVDRVSRYVGACDIEILSGDDPLTLPMMAVGAVGVISVAGNIIPREVTALVHSALDGNWDEARRLHREWHPLFDALFLDTNPIPVKAALAMAGRVEEVYRLPLCPMDADNKERLRSVMRTLGII